MQQMGGVGAIRLWRAELLTRVLRFVFALGVFTGVPTILFAIEASRLDIVAIDVVVLVLIGVVTFATSLAYRLRAAVLLFTTYGLGLFLLVSVGAVGQIYLLALPVLAAVLLGMRAAVATLSVNAATLTVVGIVGSSRPQMVIPGFDGGVEWVVISINLLFVNAAMALTCALLLRRIERSLVEEQALSASLSAQREALGARNRELEREILERRAAEDQQRFQAQLLEAVGEAVVATDVDGRVRYFNPVAEHLYGWEDLEPLGRPVSEMLNPHVSAADAQDMRQRLRRDETWAGELEISRHDGTTFPAWVTAAPYYDVAGGVAGTIGVATDISRLRRTIDRLARSEEIRIAFLRATSHELRTPLTAIVGLIETLGSRDGELEAPQRAHLIDRMAVNAGRLAQLITDLLDVDRLSSGLVSANRQLHDLRPLVLRVVDELEIPDRNVLTDLESVVVDVDAAKIERVVTNLIANAARHTETGGTVWVHLSRDVDTILLRVSDDGSGIDPDYLEHIFEPFVQGPERHNDAKPGTGLGLSLARELVRLHGGHITATNRSPRGAAFEVRLPDQHTPAAS